MDAWVATGMKIGRGTEPWGSVRVLARALVVYSKASDWNGAYRCRCLTEHFAWRSKVKAEGMGLRGAVDMVAIGTRIWVLKDPR